VQLNLARRGVYCGHRFRIGSKQRTGIYETLGIEDFDIGLVRVAVEHKVHVQLLARSKLRLVAVKYGESPSAQLNSGGYAVRKRDSDAGQIRQQAVSGRIRVSPYKREWFAKQFVENFDATHVAAMNEVLGAGAAEKLHGLAGSAEVPVRVGHDTDDQVIVSLKKARRLTHQTWLV